MATEAVTQIGKELCECGDYRDQHDALGCKVCRHRDAPWDVCVVFRRVS